LIFLGAKLLLLSIGFAHFLAPFDFICLFPQAAAKMDDQSTEKNSSLTNWSGKSVDSADWQPRRNLPSIGQLRIFRPKRPRRAERTFSMNRLDYGQSSAVIETLPFTLV